MGASGSSMIKANDLVPSGTPDQESCGERLSPSRAYFMGIVVPLTNPEHVSSKGTFLCTLSIPRDGSSGLNEEAEDSHRINTNTRDVKIIGFEKVEEECTL